MPGCKLWLTTTNGSCKRGKIFYLPIFTHGAWSLLWLIFIYSRMSNWGSNYTNGNGHCLSGLCITMGSNIFLGGNSNYKPFLSYSLFRGWLGHLTMGGFAVDNATLTRFFSLHFLLPFVIAGQVGVHLLFLHETGSNNPLGVRRDLDKLPFHPYFSVKDLFGVFVILGVLFWICLIAPWALGDPENFIPANPLVTPVHIQPEWYFLMAYAILRSIPNKLGGVIALALSILVLMVCPFIQKQFSKADFLSTV